MLVGTDENYYLMMIK